MAVFEVRDEEAEAIGDTAPDSFNGAYNDPLFQMLFSRWAHAAAGEGSFAWGSLLFIQDHTKLVRSDSLPEESELQALRQIVNAYLSPGSTTPAGAFSRVLTDLVESDEFRAFFLLPEDEQVELMDQVRDAYDEVYLEVLDYLDEEYPKFINDLEAILLGRPEGRRDVFRGTWGTAPELVVEPTFDAGAAQALNQANLKNTDDGGYVGYALYDDKLFIGDGHPAHVMEYWESEFQQQGRAPSKGWITMHRSRFGAGSISVSGCLPDDELTFRSLVGAFSDKKIVFE